MTVTCSRSGTTWTIRKGAPEAVIGGDLDPDALVDEAIRRAAGYAADGARVIAVAASRAGDGDDEAPKLHLLGLVALRDPARSSAATTVAACRQAGMLMVLVTGDHPATADAIARQVGIRTHAQRLAMTAADALVDPAVQPVVARATPEDKLALVRHWQRAGHVVAMTGDGVNDGPALQTATWASPWVAEAPRWRGRRPTSSSRTTSSGPSSRRSRRAVGCMRTSAASCSTASPEAWPRSSPCSLAASEDVSIFHYSPKIPR